MKFLLLCLLAVALMSHGHAAASSVRDDRATASGRKSLKTTTPTPTAALRCALSSSATWEMTRQIGENGPRLVSSGTVDCVLGSGIVWRVTAPFESSVAMTTNAMVFTDEEGTRVKPLAELPHYEEIRARTDAFAAGDEKAFDGLFRLSAAVQPEGGWSLTLEPEIPAMEHLFTAIVLSGAALPTNAVLKTADGGFCDIRFTPTAPSAPSVPPVLPVPSVPPVPPVPLPAPVVRVPHAHASPNVIAAP